LLQDLADTVVKPGAAGCAEVLVDGVVEERVGERKTPGGARGFDQDRGGDRLLEQLQQLVVRILRYLKKQVHVEVASDHRRDRECLLRPPPETVEPAGEPSGHTLRKV